MTRLEQAATLPDSCHFEEKPLLMGPNLLSSPRIQQLSRTGILLGLIACAGLSPGPFAQVPAEAVSESPISAFGTWGTWAALAVQDGRIVILDVTDGRRFEWQAPATPVLALAVP